MFLIPQFSHTVRHHHRSRGTGSWRSDSDNSHYHALRRPVADCVHHFNRPQSPSLYSPSLPLLLLVFRPFPVLNFTSSLVFCYSPLSCFGSPAELIPCSFALQYLSSHVVSAAEESFVIQKTNMYLRRDSAQIACTYSYATSTALVPIGNILLNVMDMVHNLPVFKCLYWQVAPSSTVACCAIMH